LRLLLDEMYPSDIAALLRRNGHDAVSVHERRDLPSKPDPTIFAAAQAEQRAVLTNNVRDYTPIVTAAARDGVAHYGVILTSDRSLPRSRHLVGLYAEVLDELMSANPEDDALLDRIVWLTRPT
jgi:hypothetical protein